jgi:hypothetical protein
MNRRGGRLNAALVAAYSMINIPEKINIPENFGLAHMLFFSDNILPKVNCKWKNLVLVVPLPTATLGARSAVSKTPRVWI